MTTFTARDADLMALDNALRVGDRVALHGIPGVGKTQLALAWAHRRADQFDIAWQVRAADRLAAVAGVAQLAESLGLTVGTDLEQAATVVVTALCGRDRWLLIFDDATPAAVRGLIPPRNGHVLLTSRNPNWETVAHTQEVDLLSPESAATLLTRTGDRSGETTVDATTLQLAERLGYLPLALEQARAYCAATGRTPADYLNAVQQHRLLQYETPQAQHPTIDATITVALRAAGQIHAAAPYLVQFLAHLAVAPIPRDLCTAIGARHVPAVLSRTVHDPAAYDRALQVLAELALVNIRNGAIRIHQLAAEVIRRHHPAPPRPGWWRFWVRRTTWAQVAADALSAALPSRTDDPEEWPRIARLYPHVTAVAQDLPASADRTAGLLLGACGLYAKRRGELKEAKRLLAEAHSRLHRRLGATHQDTLTALNNLAEVLIKLGELADGQALHERALGARRQILGPDHRDTLTSMNDLAEALARSGNFADARTMHEEVLAARRRVLGNDHYDTLVSMNNFAIVLARLGHLADAQAMHEETLAATRRRRGDNHPDTLGSANNLAGVLAKLGRLVEARAMQAEALAAVRRILGDDHPHTLTAMTTFANILAMQGELVEARAMHRQILSARQRVLGDRHRDTVASRDKLAQIEEALGRPGSAEQ
ncbi:FxSxx-COOH system tetratricopeptide repeat protein [Dactylosporangium sp. CS-047395]|uniref:FxSxx-COOH system tetratricopeptide repeat protein n=1 Tax=Dactylosporangium sp. CS-047395 TaxID=3239936 RepID=UPI003D89C70D